MRSVQNFTTPPVRFTSQTSSICPWHFCPSLQWQPSSDGISPPQQAVPAVPALSPAGAVLGR